MVWPYLLVLLLGSLLIVFLTGLPVAFTFIVTSLGAFILFFGFNGIVQLTDSIFTGLSTFVLLPVPLFILMGDVMFRTGIGPILINTLGKWMGRIPGRLSLLAVAAGVLLATLTGTALASVAILGSALIPEMEKQGYKKAITLGPIMASGSLAAMIPPSALAVLLGAIGQISVGKILMAIIIPGLLLAVIFAAYIIIRCWLDPTLAPRYDIAKVSLAERFIDTAKYVLPQGIIIFLVIGVIYLGMATPEEAAACGALGMFILAMVYKKLNWKVAKDIVSSSLLTTGMILLILAGANAFSQILAFSGATGGLGRFATELPVAPIVIIIATQVVLLILGMFIDAISMMMVTLPIFVPVAGALGFDLVWFAVLFMIQIGIGGLTPPFGMLLFVMKGVAPPSTTIRDCIMSGLPFVGLNFLVLALIIVFPAIALWLPAQMRMG